jgi:class 3 adenylate cyclase
MRLFPKLLLLIGLGAALPLGFYGVTAWLRTRALGDELLRTSAETKQTIAQAGEDALFAESRRLHHRVVEVRAAELEAFFEDGRRLVQLQSSLAGRALADSVPAAGPPLRSDVDMAALRKNAKDAAAVIRVEPYVVYRLAPGTDPVAVRPKVERLARLGDFYAFSLREAPSIKSIYIGTTEGILVGYPGAAPFPEGYDPRKRDWYSKAVERGRVTWSNIYLDKDGKPVITCAEPIFVDDKLFGVSAVDIALEKLLDKLFDLIGLPATDALFVNYQGGVRIAAAVQADGHFAWRSWGPDDAPSVADYEGGVLAPAFEAAQEGKRSGTLQKNDDLLSYAAVNIKTRAGGKDWYYLVRTPLARVTGPARGARTTLEGLQDTFSDAIGRESRSLAVELGLVALLALAAALAVAWFAAKDVSRPLVGMAAAVRQIGTGDFEVRVPPGGADDVGEVARAINERTAGLKEGAFVKSTFKRYLAASVVDQIIRDPDSLKLGGEERELTVFFSDMSGFTGLSERLEPQARVGLINEYLSSMTDSIFQQEGTLDKYEGDAIMAFWGAPIHQPDHARRACLAALDNRARLKELCKGWAERGLPEFDIRVGINTGPMVVGNVGSPAHMDYTVLGDAVNTGARLEQLSKTYGTHILISEATQKAAGDSFVTRELDVIQLRGQSRHIRVYELLGLAGQFPEATLRGYRLYETGLVAYRENRWTEAEEALRGALGLLGEDKPTSIMLDEVRKLRSQSATAAGAAASGSATG